MQNGVSTIIIPASPKWKDLLRLDEVPRKRRKFLDASTTVTEGYLPQLPVVELAKPVVVSMTEAQLALPALELVMEAASLAVQEASLEMLEAQSPTLMIQGILGELNPMGDTVNAHGVIEGEEKESSSTPEKEDAEDGKAVSIVQVLDSPAKQSEVPVATDASLELAEALSQGESLVVIEESILERDTGDPEALKPR